MIGTTFKRKGRKNEGVCTVVDELTTINSKGEVVGKEIVYETEFLGQKIRGTCPYSTVVIGLIKP